MTRRCTVSDGCLTRSTIAPPEPTSRRASRLRIRSHLDRARHQADPTAGDNTRSAELSETFKTSRRDTPIIGGMAVDSTPDEIEGRVFRRGAAGYDARRSGFNTAIEHHPEMIVEAATPADVVTAVSAAVASGWAVAVMNTGHGPSIPADGAVLIRTGRLRQVDIDPASRTARIEAGARWGDVIDAAAPFGLAPLNGSSPAVGAVGYTLGGGVGHLARRFGFAADHVRWLDVVTADGQLRHVTADSDPDLFWALRGAGANFGLVTSMEIDLFPVPSVLGGELCFEAAAGADLLHAYVDWAADVPETMASSVLLLDYPDEPAIPFGLRGRHITHLRVAFSGDDFAEGADWLERLRQIGPCLVDTVRVMPYRDIGSIHHEPTDEPVPALDRNILLREVDHDAAQVMATHAGSDSNAPFLTELRARGGALARSPTPPNAVGGRDARFSLAAISDPLPASRVRRDRLLAAMEPWATGATYTNFAGVEDTSLTEVRRAYRADDFVRLRQIKTTYDPDNTFRVNFNIPPDNLSQERSSL